jgi:hypothetical protein
VVAWEDFERRKVSTIYDEGLSRVDMRSIALIPGAIGFAVAAYVSTASPSSVPGNVRYGRFAGLKAASMAIERRRLPILQGARVLSPFLIGIRLFAVVPAAHSIRQGIEEAAIRVRRSSRLRGVGRRIARTKRWGASSRMRRWDSPSTPRHVACRTPAARSDWGPRTSERAAP